MGQGAAKPPGPDKLLAAIGAIAAVFGFAHASPWARIDGEMLVISRADYFQADLTSQDPAGGTFRAFNNDTYFEYGLTDDIMLGGKVVYGTSWLVNAYVNSTDSGFSEIEAFAQYQFARNDTHAASIKLSAGRPAAFHPDARDDLSADGADVELAALYGRDMWLGPVKIFAAAEAGYRMRIGASADVIKTQLTLGVEPSKRWVMLLEGFTTTSLRNESFSGADYDIIRIQPSLVYRFNRRWAIQAGASQDISTRNLAPGRNYFISLWTAF